MNGTETSLQDVARAAYEQFEQATRTSGESFYRLRDDAPKWITDAIHDAHGERLPDDWTYDVCRDAFEFIADNDGDPDDLRHEFADDVEIYSAKLAEWYGESGYNRSECEEGREEFGTDPDASIDKQIMVGQYVARSRIFSAIAEACEEQASS